LEESRNPYLQLDGRILDVALAVTRENLDQKKQEADKKEHKDKRNLFLAREGCKILNVYIRSCFRLLILSFYFSH
jgi:hypothetical protein